MSRSNRWLVVGVIAALSFAGGAVAAKEPKPPKRIPPPTLSTPSWEGTIPAEWGELRSSNHTSAGIWNMIFEADDGTLRLVQMAPFGSELSLGMVFRRTTGAADQPDAAEPDEKH